MRDVGNSGRLIGIVQVHVGSKVFALPVQAVSFGRDRTSMVPGGFFSEGPGQYGIIVDGNASQPEVEAQIAAASADAVRHISRRFFN